MEGEDIKLCGLNGCETPKDWVPVKG